MKDIKDIDWRGAKLHVGCGAHHLPPPWVNTDGCAAPVVEGRPAPPPDCLLEVTRDLAAIPEGSLAHVYWCHGPEHVFADLLPDVWERLYWALAPGGLLTVATTDLEGIYEHRFLTQEDGPYWEAAIFGAQCSGDPPAMCHRDLFTYAKLDRMLAAVGFDTRPWQLGDHPEIDALRDYAVTARAVSVLIEGVHPWHT